MEQKHLRQRQAGCKGSEAELAQRVQGKAPSNWSRGRRRVVTGEMEGSAGRTAEKRGAFMAIVSILTFTRVVWKPLENSEGGATGPDICFNKTSLAAVF